MKQNNPSAVLVRVRDGSAGSLGVSTAMKGVAVL